jgi:hypothetical protein
LGQAASFELSIQGIPSSLVKTSQPHGTLDLSQLPNGCWIIKVHAVTPFSREAVSSPQLPVNGSCQRFWGVDFGSDDYLMVQLNRD